MLSLLCTLSIKVQQPEMYGGDGFNEIKALYTFH